MRAFESGPLANVEVAQDRFLWARHRFYELMGWDAEGGVPTDECLGELGIDRLLK